MYQCFFGFKNNVYAKNISCEILSTTIHVCEIDYKTDTVICDGCWAHDTELLFQIDNVNDLHIHDLLWVEINSKTYAIEKWYLYESFNPKTHECIFINPNVNTKNDVSIYDYYMGV